MTRSGRPRQDDTIAEVVLAQEHWSPAEARHYQGRVFAQTSLPYRDPGQIPVWERRNRGVSLILQPGHERNPVTGQRILAYPFGVIPRLVLTWMCSEAVVTKDPELILGASLTEFMDCLGMVHSGGRHGSNRRFRSQVLRLLRSTISVVDERDPERDVEQRASIGAGWSLWWDDKNADQASLMPSTVRLSGEFFKLVTTRPVPVDLPTLRSLTRYGPMALDLYTWLTWRMFSLKGPGVEAPWESLSAQFGSQYEDSRQGRYNFREAFKAALGHVRAVYPTARIEITGRGLALYPSATHVPSKHSG
jgi:Plasmid encoded RepA protein